MLEAAKVELHAMTKEMTNDPTQDQVWLLKRLTHYARIQFPEELLQRRVKFAASVLGHLSNEYKNPVLFTQIDWNELVLETLKEPPVNPASLYPDIKYDGPFEELIEKLVLLHYIDSPAFSEFTFSQINVMALMYGGQFNKSIDSVKAAFNKAKSKYTPGLVELLTQELHFIKELPGTGRKTIDLQTHTKDILERRPDITIELYQSAEQDQRIMSLLSKQIEANILAKIEAGISQTREIKALKMLESGETNTYNQEIASRLLVEANAKLKLLRLPESLKKYERMLVQNIKASQLLTRDFTPQEGQGTPFLFDERMPLAGEVSSHSREMLTELGMDKALEKFEAPKITREEVIAMGGKELMQYDLNPTKYGLKSEFFREGDTEFSEKFEKMLKLVSAQEEHEKNKANKPIRNKKSK